MKCRCDTCPTIGDCKQAFGRYWSEKSSGGTGCEHPFSYERRRAPKREAEPKTHPMPTYTPPPSPGMFTRRKKKTIKTQGELL